MDLGKTNGVVVHNILHCIFVQLEHANEKYKLLESNCSGLKREATALRDKCEKLSLSCAKLETSYETAKHELSEVKEKLMKSEVCCGNDIMVFLSFSQLQQK